MNPDRNLRLLILTSSFPNGLDDGTCGYVREFAHYLSGEFNVTVLAPANQKAKADQGKLYWLIRSSSLLPPRFDPFQSATDLNRLQEAGFFTKLMALISLTAFFLRAVRLAFGADVICSHWLLPSGLIGGLLSKLLGKPHVAIEHSGALHLLTKLRGGKWLTKFIVSGSRRVIIVSEDLRHKLTGLCPDANSKIEVLPMGVALPPSVVDSPADSLSPVERRILFVGRLIPIKGVDILLEALRENQSARLIIAGDGPERNRLERLAAQLSVNAEFIGQINAATRDDLMRSCDAVVIPSRVLENRRTEGLPVVCLEAMAAGCAIVASRTGGLAEVIRDQHNGILFEPGDAATLAEKLNLLLNNAALRKQLGENAKRKVADYAWPRIATRFIHILKDSLDTYAIDDDKSARTERTAC